MDERVRSSIPQSAQETPFGRWGGALSAVSTLDSSGSTQAPKKASAVSHPASRKRFFGNVMILDCSGELPKP